MIDNKSKLIAKLGKLKHFKSNTQILESAVSLFEIRFNVKRKKSVEPTMECDRLFHRVLSNSPCKLYLVSLLYKNKLTCLERELVLLLIASRSGMIKDVKSLNEIMTYIRTRPADSLKITKALLPESRLFKNGLMAGDIKNEVRITNAVFEGLVVNRNSPSMIVNSQKSLFKLLYNIAKKLQDRSSCILRDNDDDLWDINSDIESLYKRFATALDDHPDWSISRVCKRLKRLEEQFILILLIAREMEYLSNENLFTGLGLAAATCEIKELRELRVRILQSKYPLRRNNYIQICGGRETSDIATENDTMLRKCEYELTPNCIDKLKIVSLRQQSIANLRKPLIKFDQLIISPKIEEAIQLGLSQVRYAHVLFNNWGINETIPYGSGVTMLFHGSPGCGKTAAAEAIAQELDKKILTINYSEIQNCWVGETEKRIVNTFQMASKSNAVLFWDEADAMFYDRESADKTFEVRNVNVLLQEIERFNGVCILATNRIASLDKALLRRISLKIEFERPDKELRNRLWRVLIPTKFPLDKDVNIDKLAEEELSGGQIKNIILNAARLAIQNGANSRISQAIFEKALHIEKEGVSENQKIFGFGRRCG